MNWMYIDDNGFWACQHCCTSALLIGSVLHFPDCPVILAEAQPNTVLQADESDSTVSVDYLAEEDYPF
jgi:hypothetical protein